MVIRPYNVRFLGYHILSRVFMEVTELLFKIFLMRNFSIIRKMNSKCVDRFRGPCNVEMLCLSISTGT